MITALRHLVSLLWSGREAENTFRGGPCAGQVRGSFRWPEGEPGHASVSEELAVP